LKTQFSAEDKAAYAAMDDASFSFTAKQLRQFSGKTVLQIMAQAILFTHRRNLMEMKNKPLVLVLS
jgi:hypothetical protein